MLRVASLVRAHICVQNCLHHRLPEGEALCVVERFEQARLRQDLEAHAAVVVLQTRERECGKRKEAPVSASVA